MSHPANMPPRGPDPYLAPPTTAAPAASKAKAGLLDVRFTRFLSLSLISIWWVVALIVLSIGTVVAVVAGLLMLRDEGLTGLLWVVASLVGGVVLTILTRLFLESVAVLFRIANNTSQMAANR